MARVLKNLPAWDPGGKVPPLKARLEMFANPIKLPPGLTERFDNALLPCPSWKRFRTEETDARCLFAPADDPVAVLRLISGLNAQPLIYQDEIKWLNDQGITVLGMALPTIDPDLPIEEGIKKFFAEGGKQVHEFLFDPRATFKDLVDPRLPHFAKTHSTGGLITSALLMRENAVLDPVIQNLNQVNPYFGFNKNAFAKALFEWEAGRNFNKRSDETLGGRFYVAFMNPKPAAPDYCFNPRPFLRELVAINGYAGAFLEDIRSKGIEKRPRISENPNFSHTVTVSKKDAYSNPKIMMEVAQLMGANVVLCEKAHHWPYREFPQFLQDSAINILDMATSINPWNSPLPEVA